MSTVVDGDRWPEAGDEVLGCRLDARLGGQADGTVWRAGQASQARDVVVKVVPRDEVDPGTARQLATTVRRLQRVAPPYAADVLAADVVGDHLVSISRLVPGEELAHRVHRDGPMEPAAAVSVLAQVAACLDALHRAGIVHGAVDARHVLVTDDRPHQTATLVELGLSRLRRDDASGHIAVAPEVRAGDVPIVPSDVYGLASLLHLMVTGVQPSERGPFSPWRDDERGRLLSVASLGLAPSPADRPPGARALADAAAIALDLVPHEAARQRTHSGQPTEQPRVTLEDLEDLEDIENDAEVEERARRRRRREQATSTPPIAAERPGRTQLPQTRPETRPETRPATTPTTTDEAAGDVVDRRARAGLLVAAGGLATLVAASVLWAVGGSADDTQRAGEAGAGVAAASADVPMRPESGPSISAVEVVGSPEDRQWGTVRPGVIGPQVTAFEWLLYAGGSKVTPDGVYDAPTVQMVSDFQVSAGLPVTGLVDPATWQVLAQPIAAGDTGPRVRALQKLLRVEKRLRVDGAYDDRTAATVTAFQRRTGLEPTGQADVETWATLSRAWG